MHRTFFCIRFFAYLTIGICLFLFVSIQQSNAQHLECPSQEDPNLPKIYGKVCFEDEGVIHTCEHFLPAPPFPTYLISPGPPLRVPTQECIEIAKQSYTQCTYWPISIHELNGASGKTNLSEAHFRRGIGDQVNVDYTCESELSCPSACIPIQEVSGGNCNANCNFTLVDDQGGCLPIGESSIFPIIGGSGTGTVCWGQGFQSCEDGVKNGVRLSHTYDNAGVFDIRLFCGTPSNPCIKRVVVLCQGEEAPPLPTTTPTPTPESGTGPCLPPLECLHPCACNSSTTAYAFCDNTDVTIDGSPITVGPRSSAKLASNRSSVLGAQSLLAQATEEEGSLLDDVPSCGPELFCCLPQAQSGGSWYKLQNASFYKYGNVINPIPDEPIPYDGDDTGECNDGLPPENPPAPDACLLRGDQAGSVIAEGFIDTLKKPVSFRSWKLGDVADPYIMSTPFSPAGFLSYIKARKEYTRISGSLTGNIGNGSIFVTDPGDYTINNNNSMNSWPDTLVLIVDGNLTIDNVGKGVVFNNNEKEIAIIVTGTLNISSGLTQMNGIFIAQDVNFSYNETTTTNPLKIVGGLVSYTESPCTDQRIRTDSESPSCFFVQDVAGYYIPLMKWLGTRSYQWTEPVM